MSNPPGRFSNAALFLWMVLWLVITVPFIGKWAFALPFGLFVWGLWKANKIDRDALQQDQDLR